MDGRFILKPDSNYPVSIIVQSIGYQSKDITVQKDEADSLRIVLEIESYALQDVVVIGYGKSSRKTLTGAVSKIKSTTVAAAATSDSPLLAIQGQASGVYLEQTSGDPGATVNLIIRGKT